MIRPSRAVFAMAVAGLILSVTPVSAGSAAADREALEDATRDVWSPVGGRTFSHEGSVVNTDLDRTVVRHSPRAVVAIARYVELRSRASDEITFYGYLRTSRARTFEVVVEVDWLGRGADYLLLQHGRNNDVSVVNCKRLGGRTSFARETLRINIPRSCVGRPRWVRFQGVAESYTERGGRFLDQVIGTGARPKGWSPRIRA